MIKSFLNLEDSLVKLIGNAVKKSFSEEVFLSLGQVSLELPEDYSHGDISSNCALRLSKSLGKSPRLIADSLKAAIEDDLPNSLLKDIVDKVQVAGPGFINFFISNKYFYNIIRQILNEDINFGRLDIGKRGKVQVEFVSANPTGPLSIAHARQAAVGDSLARILNFLGFCVVREYYLNDEGNQINILGRSIELRLKELNGETVEFPEDYYQGDYIKEIATKISAEGGSASGGKNAKLKIKNLNETVKIYSEYGVKEILDGIKKDLTDFNVNFDIWYSQGELTRVGKITQVIDYLKVKGFIYESEGAVWFKSTVFGDDKDRVIIKSDKTYTYLAPDIAYHRDKFERGFSRVINLWGPDHHGYIPRMKAAVLALGQEKEALSVVIVQLVTLFREGKPVRMSTRKACYVTLREIIDEIGRDAARYFLVNRKVSSHLDFDLELAKKQSQENPVYYIQYAFARISSIFSKAAGSETSVTQNLSLLNNAEELSIMRKLNQFTGILQACLDLLDPYPLAQYLSELAAEFHKFYDLHKVLDESNPGLSNARLSLMNAVRIVLRNGLSLLGLSSPERM